MYVFLPDWAILISAAWLAYFPTLRSTSREAVCQAEEILMGHVISTLEIKVREVRPCVSAPRRHIGTVMISLANLSSMRDFPVPAELTMHVCLV
jgi:hypothetical protein